MAESLDLQCADCGTHFSLDPGGSVQGAACDGCGGNRFYREQPTPTRSDMTQRNMVDNSVGVDRGGNPLGEGIMAKVAMPRERYELDPEWQSQIALRSPGDHPEDTREGILKGFHRWVPPVNVEGEAAKARAALKRERPSSTLGCHSESISSRRGTKVACGAAPKSLAVPHRAVHQAPLAHLARAASRHTDPPTPWGLTLEEEGSNVNLDPRGQYEYKMLEGKLPPHIQELMAKRAMGDEAPPCPMCGGPGGYMGSLGMREHFRCRNCGMDFSSEDHSAADIGEMMNANARHPDLAKGTAGNPFAEGTIMGDDGERPQHKRDNYMHGKVANEQEPWVTTADAWMDQSIDPTDPRSVLAPVTRRMIHELAKKHYNEGRVTRDSIGHWPEAYKQAWINMRGFKGADDLYQSVTQNAPSAIDFGQANDYRHPDPWMDNEPGTMTFPESWNRLQGRASASIYDQIAQLRQRVPADHQHIINALLRDSPRAAIEYIVNNFKSNESKDTPSVAWNMLGIESRMTPYAPLWDESYVQASLKQAGPVDDAMMAQPLKGNPDPGASGDLHTPVGQGSPGFWGTLGDMAAFGLTPLGLGVGAEALGVGAGAADAAGAEGASAATAEGGASGAANAGGGAAGTGAAMNAVKNIGQGVGKHEISSLMKGALGAGVAGAALEAPVAAPSLEAVSHVRLREIPALLAGAWDSARGEVPSVDEHHDDPEKQDQKEFNDGDKKPSNPKNPNNDDSGASGEDGKRQKGDGYGFGPNSPALERAEMLMPLLLHYYQSEESGMNDPLVRSLHEMFEAENPDYLKHDSSEGHQGVQLLIERHKAPKHAAVPPMAPTDGTQPGQMQPGMPQHPHVQQCPNCGGALGPDGTCPNCQQNEVPQAPTAQGGPSTTPPQAGGGGGGMGFFGTRTPWDAVRERYKDVHPFDLPTEGVMMPSEQPDFGNHWTLPTPSQEDLRIEPGLADTPTEGWEGPAIRYPQGELVSPHLTHPPFDARGLPVHRGRTANKVGPQTPEQFAAVEQLLIQQHREDEIPNMQLKPWLYAKELAQIQGQQNTAPLVDPSEATPPPQPPMPGGAMPVVDPSQAGGGGGMPLQPMSKKARGEPYTCPECHHRSREIGEEGICPYCHATPNVYGDGNWAPEGQRPTMESLMGAGVMPALGKTADANNHVKRCPNCGSASTRVGPDGVDSAGDAIGFCPSCQSTFPLDQEKASRVLLAAVPAFNPQIGEMTWKDAQGQPIKEGGYYEVYAPGFIAPDRVQVVAKKATELGLKLVGDIGGVKASFDSSPDFKIKASDAQKYSFEPYEEVSEEDTASKTPGHAQIPPSGPSMDELRNSFPNAGTLASTVVEETDEICHKCGNTMIDHYMTSPESVDHSCVKCGSVWTTLDRDGGFTPTANINWVLENNEELPTLDDRFAARTAGRKFTPKEQRELINEKGKARNLSALQLDGTHYHMGAENDLLDDAFGLGF